MYRYIILTIIFLLLYGCHRHPYYDMEDYTGGVLTVNFDWEGYIDIPPGMNLYFYPIVDSDSKDYDYSGNPIPIGMRLDLENHEVTDVSLKVDLPAGDGSYFTVWPCCYQWIITCLLKHTWTFTTVSHWQAAHIRQ